MKFIFGGAYQGKYDWVKARYEIEDERIFVCSDKDPQISFDCDVIYGMEKFVLACSRSGTDAEKYLRASREELEDKIIVCTDISQGVVPEEKQQRQWRENSGRIMTYLAYEAEEVIRIFCGLEQRLK